MNSDPNAAFLLIGVAIIGLGTVSVALIVFFAYVPWRPFLNGVDGMVGARVVAITALAPEGRVNFAGENWAAVLAAPNQVVRAGAELQVIAVEGLRLRVRPLGSNNHVESDFVVHSH